jgi:hypothetical protein
MLFAQVENGEFVTWVNLVQDYPHTSFPTRLTASDLPEGVVMVHRDMDQPTGGLFARVVRAERPVYEHGRWVLPYRLNEMTPAEQQVELDAIAATVRAERDHRLTTSDWTQIADAPADRAAWAAYRQALRAVPEQAGFPLQVIWPSMPPVIASDPLE